MGAPAFVGAVDVDGDVVDVVDGEDGCEGTLGASGPVRCDDMVKVFRQSILYFVASARERFEL
jgi:hypothetical protein